jgi:hypothetical protein
LQDRKKITQIWILGLKICHLATLATTQGAAQYGVTISKSKLPNLKKNSSDFAAMSSGTPSNIVNCK